MNNTEAVENAKAELLALLANRELRTFRKKHKIDLVIVDLLKEIGLGEISDILDKAVDNYLNDQPEENYLDNNTD